ncbi:MULTISPECIES: LacI family DNA-binding transcriptional regulator [Streptomyces]|uniref:LacI family DNA-binding transcriptional regulator n=1 Tax=Streptomyces evansiae TaxID=3075535 RepID=A0ABD5ECI1_9ACTN|nr:MULTISPECIES: LacI family DNA-binding transcriptional regulator [unclassified Streptomyces]ASY33666.1 LacI family transcriptional regulator [Streptomyces sp. CLI2509]EGJ75789.1 putative LacI family transcriptional regulator [Streptomyces sp. Tu6071]MDT0419114.1 LacI family DNA-binding transcriptional regulator [Streptomyces sp. DSM 41982]MYX23860.1 substrate-binding domain-containing protein [Streptomyces sp. SID8380]
MAKVTRDDVARRAGTSTAVVSYVINNGPRPVAPATRERVLAAIKELGYRPDRVAQAMASRRTDLIGLIVPDARQPFFAEMAHAVEQAASERGKMVLVGNSDYADAREVHYLRAFLGMRVAGLILVSQGPSETAAAEIDAWDARIVLLHRRPSPIDDVAVVTDDVGGAQLATRHLLEHGAPYVACLGGTEQTPAEGDPVSDHIEGWRRAMTEAGLPTEGRLFQSPYNRYDAYKVGLELLAGPDRPPALVCATDDQAIGILRAARELRIDVPGELAVAGFDDVKEAALTDPPLTTVASDRTAMARAAVDLVLDDALRVTSPRRERLKVYPSRLVIRRSCGCH